MGCTVNVLGIDPGKDGAAVLLHHDGLVHGLLVAEVVGTKRWEAVHTELTRWLREIHGTWHIDRAVLELHAGRPGEGAASARTIGIGWGLWLGALSALRVPVILPTPQRWQKALLADLAGDPKDRSIAYCSQHLPNLDLTPGRRRKPHDGLADAGCLAMYGRSHHV